MQTKALLASVLLGICAAAAINLAAPAYIAAVGESVQGSKSDSALEPVLAFLRFVSAIFKDSATGLLVMHPLSSSMRVLPQLRIPWAVMSNAIIASRSIQTSLPQHLPPKLMYCSAHTKAPSHSGTHGLIKPQGVPVWYTLVGVATPALLLTALEANRHGSGGLLAWYTLFGVVLQVDVQHPCL